LGLSLRKGVTGMNWMRSFFAFLKALILFFTIFIPLLLINVLQVLSFLFFYPFSKKLFREFNVTMAGLWWGGCEWSVRNIGGIEIIQTGDNLPTEENVILISNHQGWGDIPILFKLAKEAKRIGNMKWFVKDGLKYLPAIGWGMSFIDCLFVKRNWQKDKKKIEATFKKFFDHDIPIWLMLFPEGTRFRKDKLEFTHKITEKKNLPPLKHVLMPRVKGFSASVQGLRGHCGAVYDVTILYEGAAPSFFDLFLGKVKRVSLHVERFPMDKLGREEKDIQDWIIDRFYLKNKMLSESRGLPLGH